MENHNDYLRTLLMFCGTIAFPAAIIYKFFLIKINNKKKLPALEQDPWKYGDEWKKIETTDMTDWEEILTVPQDYYKTHLYDFGSEIMKLKKPDLGKVQIFLAQHSIASKIIISTRGTMPADGLFVEKKQVAQALDLLQNLYNEESR